MERPNVMMIVLDAARYDWVCKSQILEKVFGNGTFFTNMITYAPYTLGAMHAVMTGIFGDRTGVDTYFNALNYKKSDCKSLFQYFHSLGYFVKVDASNEVIIPPLGIDERTDHSRDQGDFTKRHCRFIDKALEVNKNGQNFVLYLHYGGIHTALVRDVIDVYSDTSEEYFKNKEKNIMRYDKLFKEMEEYVESIFDKITQTGLDKNTVIVVMNDHGVSVGDKLGEKVYGCFLYDYTIKTFSCFLFPPLFPGKKINSQIRGVDIFPTILDAFKICPDERFLALDGKSLFPFINGKDDNDRISFSQASGSIALSPYPKKPIVHAIRDGKFKYIYYSQEMRSEFYDIKKDPLELNNLSGKGLIDEERLSKELKKRLNEKVI